MDEQLEQLLEVARRWVEFAEELPVLSPEDEELIEAIRAYDSEVTQ